MEKDVYDVCLLYKLYIIRYNEQELCFSYSKPHHHVIGIQRECTFVCWCVVHVSLDSSPG